jgi:carbonic anhydrase/acetyltransferase-like protein (isoleucine patch superfamily)
MNISTAFRPDLIHPTVFIGQGAVVVGDVTIAAACSVWFNAVLRADTTPVTVGEQTNIQEGVILHADPGFPTIIGQKVTIGHGAVVHGAVVGNNSLIGISAVLLNGVEIGENSIVGAGSLLPPGKKFPPKSLILGSPAKVVRQLTSEEIESNRQTAEGYVKKSRLFMQQET